MTGWQFGPYLSSFGPYLSKPDVRIGTDEREQAVQLLAQHLSAGRLELAEFEERVTAAYAARTASQLAALFRDLPWPVPTMPGYRPQRPRVSRRLILVLVLVFVIAMVAADVAFPPLFIIPIVWLLIHRRRRHYAYAAGIRRR